MLFLGAPESLQRVTVAMTLKDACTLKGKLWQTRQRIKKQRHHFAEKCPLRQNYVFSSSHIWMWELDHQEGWARKKCCYWTAVLEKTLESPLNSKEIKPAILKEINPEYTLEGLMLKLKFQYFGHLRRRTNSLGKTLILGTIEGWRKRGQQRMGWLSTQWTWLWANSGTQWKTGKPGMLQSMGSQRAGHDWATE